MRAGWQAERTHTHKQQLSSCDRQHHTSAVTCFRRVFVFDAATQNTTCTALNMRTCIWEDHCHWRHLLPSQQAPPSWAQHATPSAAEAAAAPQDAVGLCLQLHPVPGCLILPAALLVVVAAVELHVARAGPAQEVWPAQGTMAVSAAASTAQLHRGWAVCAAVPTDPSDEVAAAPAPVRPDHLAAAARCPGLQRLGPAHNRGSRQDANAQCHASQLRFRASNLSAASATVSCHCNCS